MYLLFNKSVLYLYAELQVFINGKNGVSGKNQER